MRSLQIVKTQKHMKIIDVIAAILLIIGGLAWGVMALLDFNLIAWIFRDMNILTRIIYAVIGLSAIYQMMFWKQIKARW